MVLFRRLDGRSVVIDVDEVIYPNAPIAIITANATGTYDVYINGKQYTVTLNEGETTKSVTGITLNVVKEFITTLGAADGIEAVETDLHMTALDDTVPETPNDKYFSRQWGLTSDSHGINATGAWSQ